MKIGDTVEIETLLKGRITAKVVSTEGNRLEVEFENKRIFVKREQVKK